MAGYQYKPSKPPTYKPPKPHMTPPPPDTGGGTKPYSAPKPGIGPSGVHPVSASADHGSGMFGPQSGISAKPLPFNNGIARIPPSPRGRA